MKIQNFSNRQNKEIYINLIDFRDYFQDESGGHSENNSDDAKKE